MIYDGSLPTLFDGITINDERDNGRLDKQHSLAWCGPRRWAGIAQARVVRSPAANAASARCG